MIYIIIVSPLFHGVDHATGGGVITYRCMFRVLDHLIKMHHRRTALVLENELNFGVSWGTFNSAANPPLLLIILGTRTILHACFRNKLIPILLYFF